jgi:NAD(P)-dependent dehydrogenase (short-subunit alcohol dehydrogenase family)
MPEPVPSVPSALIRNGALVTGAGVRLGRSIAETLASDGWFVAVHHNRSADGAAEVVDGITAAGGRAVAIAADLSDAAATERLIATADEATGGLAVLVNNASLFQHDDLESLSAGAWDRHMAINLRAPALLARDFARRLPPDACGCIVNLLDQKLWNQNPDFLSYTISKVGLRGLTEILAQALAPRIRVCGIAPGLLLPSGKMSAARFRELHDRNPLGRGATLGEVVDAVRFAIATPGYTGQTIIVDGGESLVRRPKDVQFDPAVP